MSLFERCEGGVIERRTARKRHRCDTYGGAPHFIERGEVYLLHKAFPHTDTNSSDRIWTLKECAGCALPYRARLLGLPPTGLRVQQLPPCPVAYCRAGVGHVGLHDIPACLHTCGPLHPTRGRLHDPDCPNAWPVAEVAS